MWGRRGFLSLLLVFVLAGATGLLGVRSRTETVRAGGYTLSLEHAVVARAGLDVPFQVTVRRPGGFGSSLQLAITGDYFDIYETQGFNPDASAATRDAHTLYLTFDAPAGDTFTMSYDAYIQPSSQLGRSGTISVESHGRALASLDFTTHLLP